jgi:uptake hydrogenase large subunit
VMCAPTLKDITRAHAIMNQFRNDWLETTWLGCSIQKYRQVQSWNDLLAWVDENESQHNSDLGLFIRASLEFGLDKFGQGCGNYIAYGTYLHKDKYNHPTVEGRNDALISPSGFFRSGQGKYLDFDHLMIKEHVGHSWYENHAAAHPWEEPIPTPITSQNLEHTDFNSKYSWAKAPRYMDQSAEAGPLSRCLMYAKPNNLPHQTRDHLIKDIFDKLGPSVFVRTLARLHEAPILFENLDQWLRQIDLDGQFYIKPQEQDGMGFGATEAARGALAHWIQIEDGVIKNYQVMAPTTWNVGPNDDTGRSGPIEAALEGIEIEDANDPVEVGMVARSFDSCLVCTVHAYDGRTGNQLARFKL